MRNFIKVLGIGLSGFFMITVVMVIVYKWVNPPYTLLMAKRQKEFGESRLKKRWVSLDQTSKTFLTALVAGEDPSFCRHKGILWSFFFQQASDYLLKKEPLSNIGGSTISQQVAKNVFLYPHKNILRKGLECYFAFLIEMIWGKKRILEVYINVIEMGKNIFGVQAASEVFFGKEAKDLNREESVALVAVLPNPIKLNVMTLTSYQFFRERDLKAKVKSSRIVKDVDRLLAN